jgi:hypothetical protein
LLKNINVDATSKGFRQRLYCHALGRFVAADRGREKGRQPGSNSGRQAIMPERMR